VLNTTPQPNLTVRRESDFPEVVNAVLICTTLADCDARDGLRIAIVGVYRFYPDLAGFDYSKAPRAVRIELNDGLGPFLEPFWSKRAIRPQSEIHRFLHKRVCVVGYYHKNMPPNRDDPSFASGMGGPCIEVETIDPASDL
jgi:hypothetical protein